MDCLIASAANDVLIFVTTSNNSRNSLKVIETPSLAPALGTQMRIGRCLNTPRLIFIVYLWTLQWKKGIFLGMSKGRNAEAQKSEVLQGTLDLMALKVLDALPAAAWVWDRPPD